MTGRERVLAALDRGQPDRVPLMPITMMFAADVAGVRYRDYVTDGRVLAEAQIRTAEQFGFDYVSVISDPAREASDLGAEIEWFDDQPPAIIEERDLAGARHEGGDGARRGRRRRRATAADRGHDGERAGEQ